MLPFFYCKQITISVLLNCMKILTTSATQSIKFIPRLAESIASSKANGQEYKNLNIRKCYCC